MQWKRLIDYLVGITSGAAAMTAVIGLIFGSYLLIVLGLLLTLSTAAMFYTAPWGENP